MRVIARNHARLVATECDILCPPSQKDNRDTKCNGEQSPRPRPRAIPRCNRRSHEHPGLPLAKCRYRTLPTDYRLPQSGASTCLGVLPVTRSPGQSHHLLFDLVPALAIQFVRAIPMSISRLTTEQPTPIRPQLSRPINTWPSRSCKETPSPVALSFCSVPFRCTRRRRTRGPANFPLGRALLLRTWRRLAHFQPWSVSPHAWELGARAQRPCQ